MKIIELDASGLKCPQPILKLAVSASDMHTGEFLDIIGDCPTFETDVRAWCKRLNKTLLFVKEEEGYRKRIRIGF